MSEYRKMNCMLVKKSALFLVFVGVATTPALQLRIKSLKKADEMETSKHNFDSDDVSNTIKAEIKHVNTGEKDVKNKNEADEGVEKEAEKDKEVHKNDRKPYTRDETDKNNIEADDADLSSTEKNDGPLDGKWDVVVDMWEVHMNEDIFTTQPNLTLQHVIGGRLSEVSFVEIERSGSNDRSLDMTWSNVESPEVEWSECEPVVTKHFSMRPLHIDNKGGDTSTTPLRFSMECVNAENDFDEADSRDGFLLKELHWEIVVEDGSWAIQLYLASTTSADVLTKVGFEIGDDIFKKPIMTWKRTSLYACGTRFSKFGRCLEPVTLMLFCIMLVLVCLSCINWCRHCCIPLGENDMHNSVRENLIECARSGECIGWIIGACVSLFCWYRLCELHANTSWVYCCQKTCCCKTRHEGRWSQRWNFRVCCREKIDSCKRHLHKMESEMKDDELFCVALGFTIILIPTILVCVCTIAGIQDAKENPLECLHFLPKNMRTLYGDF